MYVFHVVDGFVRKTRQDKQLNTYFTKCQEHDWVDLPIFEVSRSNTTSVEFRISDKLRGVDVGA